MQILLSGHSYKYALEQILLSIFPDERPLYVSVLPADNYVISELLRHNDSSATVTTCISLPTATVHASEYLSSLPSDTAKRTAILQRAIKLSFFHAASKLPLTMPPWGALTGIRPAKLAAAYIENYPDASFSDALSFFQNSYLTSSRCAVLAVTAALSALKLKQSLPEPSLSLYVSIPFCPSRCAYCSFVSHSVEKSFKLVVPYLDALKAELIATAPFTHSKHISSVYIGGGTPTILSAPQLSELLLLIRQYFQLSANTEFTVEAGRPDTITPEKLDALINGGVNRISINPQTMNDTVLSLIGRRHSANDTISAFNSALSAGFKQINTDIIAGLPGDSHDSFVDTLNSITGLAPVNITVHTLSRKRGAKLADLPLPEPSEVTAMLEYADGILSDNAYAPYYLYRQKYTSGGHENTGWSKPGCHCVYNICMMEELHTVLSAGAGAVTKLVNPHNGQIERIINKKYPYEYITSINQTLAEKSYIRLFDTDPAKFKNRKKGAG